MTAAQPTVPRAPTVAPRRPRTKRVTLGTRLTQWALLLLALYALSLAVPATYAGLLYGLSADLRDKLYTSTAAPEERQALAAYRNRIIPVWNAWLPYDDLAQIVLADAYEVGITKMAGRQMMSEVLRLETEALKRNPANAYAWSRLAYARFIYNGPSRLVAEPLVQSIQAAPYEPALLPSRIVLALKIEKYWTPELAALFPQQLERAWLRQSIETVAAAYQDGIEGQLREKFANDVEKRMAFDKIISGMAPR
ncbi:MAG: hypothetical protein KBA75_07335 [Alphaproteobacteria bacterium]|nr:hypothetical protein [Alphaproteobacteria bacterium]